MSDWGLTTPVRAVVTLGDGAIHPGHLHLMAGMHAGIPESPLEMLNRPAGFFPLTGDDGSVSLVSKAQVAMVAPEWPLEGIEAWAAPGRKVRVEVTLARGDQLTGEMTTSGPVGHNRPIDYLNRTRPFFELEVGSGVRLLHGAWVATIRPLE